MDSILNAERIWNEFTASALGPIPDRQDNRRYIRINPDLDEKVPHLDEKAELSNIRKLTQNWLQKEENRITIRRISHRLIATSFYFEVDKVEAKHQADSFHCSGLQEHPFVSKADIQSADRPQDTFDANLQTVRITFENLASLWNDKNIQGCLNIVRSSRSEERTVKRKL
jgi:hypothetical protein